MTKLQVIERLAPSAWASALINGDYSGTSPDDELHMEAWLKRENLPAPVACDDAGFIWRHDAFAECPLGADCQRYTFLIET